MNRRSFLARCLSGAVLGMARVLPMPRFQTKPERVDYIDMLGIFASADQMRMDFVRIMSEQLTFQDAMLTATEVIRRQEEELMTPARAALIRLQMAGWNPCEPS